MEKAEIVMTTLNGLPRSWDSFIQGIYARKKLVKFSRLWEEYSQEESQIAAQEENIKLSQYTPKKEEGKIIITKVSILIRKVILQEGIHPNSDVIHEMK